jgi:hypothetical protein
MEVTTVSIITLPVAWLESYRLPILREKPVTLAGWAVTWIWEKADAFLWFFPVTDTWAW